MPRNERGPGALAGATEARDRIADWQRGPNSTAADPAPELQRLRRQRLAAALHKLGARVVAEFLSEVCRHHPTAAADIDERLAQYTERLTPELLAAAGGDRFAPLPVHLVRRGP